MTMHELDAPYRLEAGQADFFAENGYIKLKQVFSPALLAHYRDAIAQLVAQHADGSLPLDQRTTYGKAFLQIGNLWQESEIIREFVFGKRLAQIAATLIGARGVRIYHDQALYKEAGGGITPWHADQYYWPVSSDKIVTAWIPLQPTPDEMGPLCFSARSHRLQIGRDMEISDESEMTLKKALEHLPVEDGGFELGEVSFHAGWTFHRAGANRTDRQREVMTIIFMDADMRAAEPANRNQASDLDRWMPGIAPGELAASPLNPLLYSGGPA